MEDRTRKNYADNLRSFTVLLLFPVHTFMIRNDFGTKFYIWLGESRLLSTLIAAVNPWFMPLLFVLAGIAARHSLEKRSRGEFIRERIEKLLIPFLFGMLFLVPFQTLFARKFFFGYEGGILENLWYFFTHFTDLSGYDGGFTPGHLWFILFLLIISLATLPLVRRLPYERTVRAAEGIPLPVLLLFFIPVWLMYYLGNFGGFSLGKCLALYLIGYWFLSNDALVARLAEKVKPLALLWAAGTALQCFLYGVFAYYGDLWVNLFGWVSILFFLAFGKKRLDRRTRLTAYLGKASYPLYLLHQSILVALAYYTAGWIGNTPLSAVVICFGSLALSLAAYHVIRRIPLLRKGIGLR